jgi:hypothetical protein
MLELSSFPADLRNDGMMRQMVNRHMKATALKDVKDVDDVVSTTPLCIHSELLLLSFIFDTLCAAVADAIQITEITFLIHEGQDRALVQFMSKQLADSAFSLLQDVQVLPIYIEQSYAVNITLFQVPAAFELQNVLQPFSRCCACWSAYTFSLASVIHTNTCITCVAACLHVNSTMAAN